MRVITNTPDKPKKNHSYRNLTLSGGGILGIAECGAIEELNSLGILSRVKNFAGSSAGAIAAGVLACGASAEFLADELQKVDFSSFLDYGNKVKAVYNLYNHKGICTGDVFENWYANILLKLTGDCEITLKQVHDKYGGRLVVTATSLNTRNVVYMDWRTDPNLTLKKAVRMSMSIPFIFIPVEYNGDVWVDGGVLDHFPMKAFHKETTSVDRINSKTLGILLMTEETANYPKIDSFWTFVEALMSCYTTQTQKLYMEPQDWARTVKIQCGNISSLNFSITNDEKKVLIQAGRDAVRKYFLNDHVQSQPIFLAHMESIKTGYKNEDDETPVNSPIHTDAIPVPKTLRAAEDRPSRPYKSSPPVNIPGSPKKIYDF